MGFTFVIVCIFDNFRCFYITSSFSISHFHPMLVLTVKQCKVRKSTDQKHQSTIKLSSFLWIMTAALLLSQMSTVMTPHDSNVYKSSSWISNSVIVCCARTLQRGTWYSSIKYLFEIWQWIWIYHLLVQALLEFTI